MSDFVLSLGGVEFRDFEIPEQIRGMGGEQALVIHRLLGGRRVIDATGDDPTPREWSGRFRGADALPRARVLDQMRRAGQPVTLAFADVSETVVLRRFTYDPERFYEVPYSLSLEVVSDDDGITTPGVHEMVLSDDVSAQDAGADIDDPTLTSRLSDLDASVSAVPNFAVASQSTISGVLTSVQACADQVSAMIAAAEATTTSVSVLGGVDLGSPSAGFATALSGQAGAMSQAASLYDLQAVLGRMKANLRAIGAGGAEVVVAGGDLYRIAQDAYGDATAWATIARANCITDPVLTGVQTILIPPSAGNTGGVLAEQLADT